jgi:chorismate dehydratase
VGIVSYLNTKPLLYGIQHSELVKGLELMIDYPSQIATMLLEDEIDIGLVPVAVIPEMKEYFINTNYCIGCDGAVGSVCIFSDVPLDKVDHILLDYQSKTSTELAKVLLKEYWKVNPVLTDGGIDFIEHIKGSTAGLVIGDRALEQRRISPYRYDLGEAWKALTGLPFVFAAWISNKKLEDSFINAFDKANREGLRNIESVLQNLEYEVFDLQEYYKEYISYDLDDRKRAGLNAFLNYLKIGSIV